MMVGWSGVGRAMVSSNSSRRDSGAVEQEHREVGSGDRVAACRASTSSNHNGEVEMGTKRKSAGSCCSATAVTGQGNSNATRQHA